MLPTKRFITRDLTACAVLSEKTVPGLPEEEELLWKMPVIHAPGRSASVFTVALMIAHPTDTGRRFVRTLSTVCANWQAN